ncbi:hypothetical protein FQZ97_1030080 [compost metagenome]
MLHLFVVMQPGAGNIRVGKNQLITFEVSYTCGFYPDLFNRSCHTVNHHKISYFKGFIKNDGKITEQVSQDILCRQRNGNTAYPHTCYQGSNIIAQVIGQKDNPGYTDQHIDNNDQSSCLLSFGLIITLRIDIRIDYFLEGPYNKTEGKKGSAANKGKMNYFLSQSR